MRFFGDIALPDGIAMTIETGAIQLDDQPSVANIEGLLSETRGVFAI